MRSATTNLPEGLLTVEAATFEVQPASAAALAEWAVGGGEGVGRQRLALAKLLAEAGDCHMTAEQLHAQSQGAGIRVSLATVYNTLHQFVRVLVPIGRVRPTREHQKC